MEQIVAAAGAVSPAGGAVALLGAALTAAVGAVLLRYNKGQGEIFTGYSDLTTAYKTSADSERQLRQAAEAALDIETGRRIQAREYARHLEDRLGVEHRQWPDEVRP
jgi:hypothetical protein